MVQYTLIVVALVLACVNSENSTVSDALDTCDAGAGPWSLALEEWATSSSRHGRIMALAPASGYYVTERIDSPLLQPPPPPSSPPFAPSGVLKFNGYKMPQHMPHTLQSYNEWEATATGPGKIVNRPPAPYKDKFRPSYPEPAGAHQHPNTVDRADEVPLKRVSETDLYLLSAIEKLVHRADLTEKRLRKIEESLHHLIAGADNQPEPCGSDFTRVGRGCYMWSRESADWKDASRACRRRGASLLELTQREDARALISALLADKKLKGDDFWTGGLNPGLLWIWSNSARPIQSNTTDNATVSISGDGRCLALTHEPAVQSYMYRGQDCGLKHRYICQLEEQADKLSNEIEKKARALRHDRQLASARLLLNINHADSNR